MANFPSYPIVGGRPVPIMDNSSNTAFLRNALRGGNPERDMSKGWWHILAVDEELKLVVAWTVWAGDGGAGIVKPISLCVMEQLEYWRLNCPLWREDLRVVARDSMQGMKRLLDKRNLHGTWDVEIDGVRYGYLNNETDV